MYFVMHMVKPFNVLTFYYVNGEGVTIPMDV